MTDSPWKNKHVLVTGGTGFLGSFLVERLLAEGATVRVPARSKNFRTLSDKRAKVEWVVGDLRDAEYCASLLKGIDSVFHLAACRRDAEYHERKCSDTATENVRMTLALIDGLKEHKAKLPHVTFFSTANIPPTIDVIALAQNEHTNGYVLGKAVCETLWLLAAHQLNFPLLTVRPVGSYGPRDTFTEEGNVIPSLFVRARDAKEKLTVWGSGEQERAFLYVEDLVEAILRLHSAGARGVQYVHAPEVVRVKELAAMICSLVRPDLPIVFDAEKPEGLRVIPLLPPHPCLDDLPWTSLSDGLKRTYDAWQATPERE